MGANTSQPDDENATPSANVNRYEIRTESVNRYEARTQSVCPYDNPDGDPIRCVKNTLARGKINPSTEKENKRILSEFLNNLLITMKERDGDFERLFHKFYYTGSYYENLRISDPNEFDIDLILKLPFKTHERMLENVEDVKSFMKYKVKTNVTNNDVLWKNVDLLNTLFEGEYLSPVKVRCWIQAVVDRARPLVVLPAGVKKIIPSASGPAKTMVLETFYGYNIDIDLVPVFQFSFPEWPKGARTDMLNTFQIEHENRFWFLVPKEFPANGTNVNPIDAKRLWRIHFPEIEKKIIHNRGQVKPLIKLLKALRDNEGWKVLASYYLKTIVLWLVEQNPSPDYWKEGNIYIRIIETLECLKSCLIDRCIPYYFYPEFNLIQKIGLYQAENMYHRLDKIIREIKANPRSLEIHFEM